MTSFRIKEYNGIFTKVYSVQCRSWGCLWITIKNFSASFFNDDDLWWARACAENLLEELQKEQ